MERTTVALHLIGIIIFCTLGYAQGYVDSVKVDTESVEQETKSEVYDSKPDSTVDSSSELNNESSNVEQTQEPVSKGETKSSEITIWDSSLTSKDTTETETFSVKENRSGILKNRNVAYVVASIPIIWLAYDYFSKNKSTGETIGTPPEWPN